LSEHLVTDVSNQKKNERAMESKEPKVSCLMVTANRPQLCRRAVRCYNNQSYTNKELVVVDDGEVDLSGVLASVPDQELTYVRLNRNPSNVLGRLRNISLDYASGSYVAQWDDDDWYHPDRLKRQAEVLTQGYEACTLAATLMHVDEPNYFEHPYAGFLTEGVPGTIMHLNDHSVTYPEVERGEDTEYLDAWRSRKYAELPPSTMHLFIRCYHGSNTWEMGHFLRRVRNSPADLLSYFWHKTLRHDLFAHPRFQLSEDAKRAFRMYLEDSYTTGIFSPG
jgi:glycosyltransferase involved in cell wall biosynthesis